jgi:pyruvate kinase
MLRRTKILATLGPATDKPGVLEGLFKAGIDVVRMNFSHGSAQDHIDRANAIRELSKKTGRRVGILADLQGPKIRIARFKDTKVFLKKVRILPWTLILIPLRAITPRSASPTNH